VPKSFNGTINFSVCSKAPNMNSQPCNPKKNHKTLACLVDSEGHRLAGKWQSPGLLPVGGVSLRRGVFRMTKALACSSNTSGSHTRGEPCGLRSCSVAWFACTPARTHCDSGPAPDPRVPCCRAVFWSVSTRPGLRMARARPLAGLCRAREALPAHFSSL